MCGLFLSGKQQAEAVVFSFNTALITTGMWQTYVHPFFNDLSACSETVLALNTPGGENPNNKDPDLANGKALPQTSAAAEGDLLHHPSYSLAGIAETTLTLTELSWLEVASVYSLSGCQSRPWILER